MIRHKMEYFTLQEVTKTKDALGCDNVAYKDICRIGVTVGKRFAKNALYDGLEHKKEEYLGITDYAMLDADKVYRLLGATTYNVVSVISGRWGQLQLERVAASE